MSTKDAFSIDWGDVLKQAHQPAGNSSNVGLTAREIAGILGRTEASVRGLIRDGLATGKVERVPIRRETIAGVICTRVGFRPTRKGASK